MDYQSLMDYRNLHNPYAARTGIRITELTQGASAVVKTIAPEDRNPLGLAHGGVLLGLADTACGAAAATYGLSQVTLSSSFNFLRSALPGDTVTARARETKHGRTISFYEVSLTNQRGEDLEAVLQG
jgi:acyl-CoA thioesterase